jgi:hypothetical protein
MRISHRLATAVTLVGGVLLVVAGAAPAPALSLASTPRAGGTVAVPRELIYVANADSGPVTAYPADSRGAVVPVRTVLAPNDPNAVWDPWTVTFDSSGHLYVQTFLSDATTFVFRPGAHGTTAPVRDFRGIGPDSRSIAVDANGYEYVAGGDQPTMVVVEPPGAHGSPGNLYYVPPVRTIELGEAWNPWPSDLAVDGQNQLLATVARPQGNAIKVYTGGAHGSGTPVRVISGPATGLGSCDSFSSPACDQLVIAFSARTDEIYAGVTDGENTHISVFAGNAAGDVKPIRTIEGPATGLAGMAITGITSSQCDGTIYAMVHISATDFTPGHVAAYNGKARGNVRPLRVFTDRHSSFEDAQGLAITRCEAS